MNQVDGFAFLCLLFGIVFADLIKVMVNAVRARELNAFIWLACAAQFNFSENESKRVD